MKLNIAIISLITVLTSSFAFANTLGLEDNGDGTWNVNYTSDGDIAGFQFNVDGATITSASGGAAGDAGFMVSSSATIALGFSLSGTTIPAGEGVLVVLGLDGNPTGLSGIIVSDPTGTDMGFTYDDGDDCASGIYDCAGVCDGDAVEDCAGECGGSAMEDECGECGGMGADVMCEDGSYVCDASDCESSGWDGDACTMPDLSIHLTSSGSVLYNSSASIAGFQFNVDGATVIGVSGGDAGDLGFMMSSSATIVLGFSLSGASFWGCGTMVELELEGEATGLSEIIISDPDGSAIPIEYFDGSSGSDVEGCMDMDACNYNADATVDDGSCEYAMENYDCDGNCTAGEDCAGECGGSAQVDECGDCNGDGPNMCWDGSYECDVADCPDEPGGTVSINYDSDTPIAGFQFDVTGVTVTGVSGGAAEAAGFMISSSATTVLGFSLTGDTIPAGSGVLIVLDIDGNAADTCIEGVILSDSDGAAIDQMVEDCVNIVAGGDDCASGIYDCAGVCDGDAVEDCAGECGGSAVVDECGECGGMGADVMCEDGSYVCDASDCASAWDGDACSMDVNSIHVTSGGTVLYNTDTPIAGFQFDVDGATVLSAAGGAAEAAGFMISSSATTVLGFSLSGDTFDGCGTMIELELDGEATSLSGVIISDAAGTAIEFTYFDGSDTGPTVVEINYSSDTPIAGFQFNVTGVTVTGVSGGAAEAAGFMVSAGGENNAVVGFSLEGATIPVGAGVLVVLEIEGDASATCVTDVILADSDGEAIEQMVEDCTNIVAGGGTDPYCGDGECNGDEDFGSCPEDCEEPGECTSDVCLSFSNFNESAGSVDIWVDNTVDVAGYQIEFDGITLTGASGGLSEDAGFMISNSGTMVLGFSVSGDVIAPSSGNLVTLTFSDYSGFACFLEDGTTFSDANAESLGLDLGDCQGAGPVEGCTDETACNYNPDANIEDGSCDYGTTCWDGSVECDASNCPDMPTVDVLYSTDTPIAGFQFIVTGATVVSASGGAAEDAGFQMAAGGGNNAVVGFSLTGEYIQGEGILTVLEIAGDPASVCIDNAIISNSDGEALQLLQV